MGDPSPTGGVLGRARPALGLLLGLVLLVPAPAARAQEGEPDAPSVLLIVTDDQRWDTLWAMPEVKRTLVDPGVTFEEAFTTSPLCCPSRASILTGGFPHTTGVYTQGLPHGGFRSFDDSSTIATALDDAGYRTGYFGKYLDSYQSDALAGYVPPGWDRWVAFVHAEYLDYGLTIDGVLRRHGREPQDYSTDVLAAEAEAFVRTSEGPVFAVFAPAAPHAPATPALEDLGRFDDLPPWRPPAFDEVDRTDKPRYVRAFRRLGTERTEALERLRRDQYRSLQAVDRAVGRLVDALEDTGRLDDALILFTSDNGLLWGEHRWLKKEVPYEEAIRVPLVVRADAIAVPHADTHLVANIDLAPTIASVAGAELPGADGASLVPLLRGERIRWRPALLIEHLRGTNPIPTYCAIRTPRYLFARYQTGESELYDLAVDPAQLRNVAGARPAVQGRLEVALRGLCDPAPPGFQPGLGLGFTLLAIAAALVAAGTTRAALSRFGRG